VVMPDNDVQLFPVNGFPHESVVLILKLIDLKIRSARADRINKESLMPAGHQIRLRISLPWR
jgi:hypothetical protein